jgi:hypothetical protein
VNVSVRTRVARTSSSSLNPGSKIEAVQAWQHTARTPSGSGAHTLRAQSPDDPERNSPALNAIGWDRTVADDVLAPSARQHTDAGAERSPDL